MKPPLFKRNLRRKWEVFVFLAIVLAYALLMFVLGMSHYPAPEHTPTPKPAEQLTQKNFSDALDHIFKLEEKDKSLEEEVAKMEDSVKESYPSEIEKETADMTSLGTFLTIVVTLAALLVAVITFNRFQKSIELASRTQAVRIVKSRSDYLAGRFDFTVGFTLGKTAWESNDGYNKTPLNYLAELSEQYLVTAYKSSVKPVEKEFKSEMDSLQGFILNNLVFYVTLNEKSVYRSDIAYYVLKLKESKRFLEKPVWINTYCRAALEFREIVARKKGETVAELLKEVRRLTDSQKTRALTDLSRRELSRIERSLDEVERLYPN